MTQFESSDKFFWHQYINFYESFFQGRSFNNIAEIGIFHGDSIRWLLSRFPYARIFGGDILPKQPDWPVDERFIFQQMDQGNHASLNRFFSQSKFDLIIEDGSHIPLHQSITLVEGIKHLAADGIYILEDIHTSYNINNTNILNPCGNSLTVLLALDHYKNINKKIDIPIAASIAHNSHFSAEAVLFLDERISSISLYKRTKLPKYCFKCGSADYNFSILKCDCGEDIFKPQDSMTFVINCK